jgi:hypothetical protein
LNDHAIDRERRVRSLCTSHFVLLVIRNRRIRELHLTPPFLLHDIDTQSPPILLDCHGIYRKIVWRKILESM